MNRYKEINEACYKCGYLHPEVKQFYKCYCGNCPAKKRDEDAKAKKHRHGLIFN